MTLQQIITYWEFVGVGVTLLAIAYGAVLDARAQKAHQYNREARGGSSHDV